MISDIGLLFWATLPPCIPT